MFGDIEKDLQKPLLEELRMECIRSYVRAQAAEIAYRTALESFSIRRMAALLKCEWWELRLQHCKFSRLLSKDIEDKMPVCEATITYADGIDTVLVIGLEIGDYYPFEPTLWFRSKLSKGGWSKTLHSESCQWILDGDAIKWHAAIDKSEFKPKVKK